MDVYTKKAFLGSKKIYLSISKNRMIFQCIGMNF